jgi:hypothetical protein
VKLFPLVLMLAGAGLMIAGMGLALSDLAGVYAGLLSDPLGQPEGAEKAAARGMLRDAALGAAGAPVFLAGLSWMRRNAARRRARLGS